AKFESQPANGHDGASRSAECFDRNNAAAKVSHADPCVLILQGVEGGALSIRGFTEWLDKRETVSHPVNPGVVNCSAHSAEQLVGRISHGTPSPGIGCDQHAYQHAQEKSKR